MGKEWEEAMLGSFEIVFIRRRVLFLRASQKAEQRWSERAQTTTTAAARDDKRVSEKRRNRKLTGRDSIKV